MEVVVMVGTPIWVSPVKDPNRSLAIGKQVSLDGWIVH
jgi:hypothetical protein